MPKVFALAAESTRDLVAVSSGLLNVLARREMAAVLAHEFAYLKNRASSMSAFVALVVQAATSVSHIFGFALLLFF